MDQKPTGLAPIKIMALTTEELKSFSQELELLLEKYHAQLAVFPIITPDGRLSAQVEAIKKVEQPIPSPFVEPDGTISPPKPPEEETA